VAAVRRRQLHAAAGADPKPLRADKSVEIKSETGAQAVRLTAIDEELTNDAEPSRGAVDVGQPPSALWISIRFARRFASNGA
jgi:hypothetical protein